MTHFPISLLFAAALSMASCAPGGNQKISNWNHADQKPGGACTAPAAPEGTVIGTTTDLAGQRLLGNWRDGAWAKPNGMLTGYCSNIAVVSLDALAGTARIYFGSSSRDEAAVVTVKYMDGTISHATPSVQYAMRVDAAGYLRVEFTEPDGTFYATLRRVAAARKD